MKRVTRTRVGGSRPRCRFRWGLMPPDSALRLKKNRELLRGQPG
jgi:hypothetical protein